MYFMYSIFFYGGSVAHLWTRTSSYSYLLYCYTLGPKAAWTSFYCFSFLRGEKTPTKPDGNKPKKITHSRDSRNHCRFAFLAKRQPQAAEGVTLKPCSIRGDPSRLTCTIAKLIISHWPKPGDWNFILRTLTSVQRNKSGICVVQSHKILSECIHAWLVCSSELSSGEL